MEKEKCYISGPITHYDFKERKNAFAEIERKLEKMNYIVVNPLKNIMNNHEKTYQEYMKQDLKDLLDCNYIYFMKKWEFSPGCNLEMRVANSCGIKIINDIE